MDYSWPGSSVHGILQARILSGLPLLLQGIFLAQGSNLHLSSLLHWQAGSLPPGKPCLRSLTFNIIIDTLGLKFAILFFCFFHLLLYFTFLISLWVIETFLRNIVIYF